MGDGSQSIRRTPVASSAIGLSLSQEPFKFIETPMNADERK
jgi:hypothetical protein